jgi:hypothetical protein
MTLAHYRYLRACLAAGAVLLGCRSSRVAHPLEAANPGATFEVRLSGCTTTGELAQRFGSSLRTALLWSSERVHSARYFPCTATIDAVTGAERHAIYRVSTRRDGSYVEQVLPRAP